MTDNELKFPRWQASLQDVILEFDRDKLPGKIQQVEALIAARLEQLKLSADGLSEREAIHDAMSILRVIKRDKLQPSTSGATSAS